MRIICYVPLIYHFLLHTIKSLLCKKFIAAFDGLNFSESIMSYAIFLAKHANEHLVGIFLVDLMRHSYGLTEIKQYEGGILDHYLHDLNEKDNVEKDESVVVFELACQNSGLNYSVHRDRNVAIQDLLHESVYADLLIIDAHETITRYTESAPTKFIRELLNDVQCPVILVPQKYEPVDNVILLYDGELSSVFAVRTYSYLFESMKHSRLFRQSMADYLLMHLKMPLFIAHNKS